jgi:extracellular factor (EF) 3-hydroxypalmitic acid methyl ester biosynthesis protein
LLQTQIPAETASALGDLLDVAHGRVLEGEVFDAMEALLAGLAAVRRSTSVDAWRALCEHQVRRHPIFEVVHQAPFTRRAFTKPRGYPGDAVTLDYIYGLERLGPAPGVVRDLYAWEFQTPSCRSVRARKALLAEQIDLAGSRTRRPRILSLACGHLREARDATLLLDRGAGAFFAVDQDADSLATVASELSAYGVDAVHGSVRGVLARKVAYADIDLAYAAGLYDYLAEPLAVQLTAKLFAMLRSGGQLLIPNFNPSLRDIGYLEAFMDWWLLYRDDDDMNRLLAAIPEAEIAGSRQFRDRHGNITVLEVTRR